jgi:ADP-heptose:LPS heptosyltransferase
MLGVPVVDLFERQRFAELSKQWSPWASPCRCVIKPDWSAGAETAFGSAIGRLAAELCAPALQTHAPASIPAGAGHPGRPGQGHVRRAGARARGRAGELRPKPLAVCTGGGVGDLLAATPALLALQRHLGARFCVLASGYAAPILQGHPAVEEILADDGGALPDLAARIAARRFTHAVVFWSSPRAAALVHRAGIPVRAGQSRRLYSWRYTHRVPVRTERGDTKSHWTDVQMDYARALGALPRPQDYRIIINLTAEDFAAADALAAQHRIPTRFIILHAVRGIAAGAKRWPARRFAALGDALNVEFGAPVVLTGSGAEREAIAAVAAAMRAPVTPLAGATSLRAFGALAARAVLVVALDSGAMHVAAAVGAPTVGIFALRTDVPARWRPLGSATAVIGPAYPCPRWHRKETCPDFACYAALDVQAIVAAARSIAGKDGTTAAPAGVTLLPAEQLRGS